MSHNDHFTTLERVVQRAIDNGWKPFGAPMKKADNVIGYLSASMDMTEMSGIRYVIYDHSFAKALWGYDEWAKCKQCGTCHYDQTDNNDNIPPYEHHLQQMVIAPDPIKYLEENM